MKRRFAAIFLAFAIIPGLAVAQRGGGGGPATGGGHAATGGGGGGQAVSAGHVVSAPAAHGTVSNGPVFVARPSTGALAVHPAPMAQANPSSPPPVYVVGSPPVGQGNPVVAGPGYITGGYGRGIAHQSGGTGFGNINHPGGGLPIPGLAPSLPGMQPLPTGLQPLPIGGGNIGNRHDGFDRRRGSSLLVVPYPYVISGYYGYDGFGYYPPEPSPSVVVVPEEEPEQPYYYYGPSVFEPDTSQDNSQQSTPLGAGTTVIQPSATAAPPEKPLTLLAFKDHSIYAVTDFWKQNERLYYVTNYGAKNNVALDQLDVDFTVKLNDERGVPFILVDRTNQ
jgi:hypothetical protein